MTRVAKSATRAPGDPRRYNYLEDERGNLIEMEGASYDDERESKSFNGLWNFSV